MPTLGAAEVPRIAARSHPQPKTNTPVPSPSTSLLALAAVQHQFLIWLLLISPLPFGAQDPPKHSPPCGETSPFTEHQVTTLSLVQSRSRWLWEQQTRFRQACPRSPGYPCPQHREGRGGGSTSAGATPCSGQARCAWLHKRLHSH